VATKVKAWTPVGDPFRYAYYQRELESMRAIKPFEDGDLVLSRRTINGPVDCYLYKDWLKLEDFPHLKVGDTIWMSVTPMEVQSQYQPILWAEGVVGVAGIGLGYALQRILSKRSVTRVIAYEVDARVIRLYERHFGKDARLKIVHGDVLEEARGRAFDLFYNDVYPVIADDALWRDWATLIQQNAIGTYHPWGVEAYLWAFIAKGRWAEVPFCLREAYRRYFDRLIHGEERAFMDGWIGGDPDETLAEWRSTGLADEWGL
jgi:hypothetical protein